MTDTVRVATIDLGSNTVRLLIAEVAPGTGAWLTVEEDQRITRLGEGLAASGHLGPAPMQRTAAAVADFVARARSAGAGPVRIVATSAVREAANGPEFTACLERRTGVPVEVVTGEDEARLTVRGIRAGLQRPPEPLLAFDIGGGSTEFILARRGTVEHVVSLRLGVVPLAERYAFPEQVDPDRYRALEEEIRAGLARGLPSAIRRSGAAELVGTAGTVTSLAALHLGLTVYDATRVQGCRMDRAAVERLRDRLSRVSVASRAALPCLEPGRADLIVPGVAIVLASLEATGTATLRVSDWGLREGIVAETVERLSRGDPRR